MKYIIWIILMFFILIDLSYWEEICNSLDTKREIYWYVQIKSDVNMRSLPCTNESKIFRVAEQKEILYVIWETEDFYLVEQNFENQSWIWKWAVRNYSGYNSEFLQAQNFVNQLEKILQKQDRELDNSIIEIIQKIIKKKSLWNTEIILFQDVFFHINNKISWNNLERISENYEQSNQNEEESGNNEYTKYSVDIEEAKRYWLELNNNERQKRWFYDYKVHRTLEDSAKKWSNFQADQSFATHKRDDNDMYYDYNKITSWLAQNNVNCKNIDTYTHTENVAWWAYYCDQDDCTQELKNAMNRTFDFYMSEENQKYRPHFLSIVNEYFTEIWVWITLKETQKNKYEFYMTIHYCTELQ